MIEHHCPCGTVTRAYAEDPATSARRLRSILARSPNLSRDKSGFVYFIQAASGPIKIGRAADARVRCAELQTGSHEELVLLATLKGGRVVERELHRRFAEHRIRGEWFHPHADILAHIAAAK